MKQWTHASIIVLLIAALVAAAIYITTLTGVGVPIQRRLVNAAGIDDLEQVKKLLAKGADLNAQETGMLGETPLIAATFGQGTNVFFFLLHAGADVNARDRSGDTPILKSVMLGDANLVKTKALIAAGADLNVSDNHGPVVLRRARMAAEGHNADSVTNTVRVLIDHGAKEAF